MVFEKAIGITRGPNAPIEAPNSGRGGDATGEEGAKWSRVPLGQLVELTHQGTQR